MYFVFVSNSQGDKDKDVALRAVCTISSMSSHRFCGRGCFEIMSGVRWTVCGVVFLISDFHIYIFFLFPYIFSTSCHQPNKRVNSMKFDELI